MERLGDNTFELTPVEIKVLEIIKDTIKDVEYVKNKPTFQQKITEFVKKDIAFANEYTRQDWDIIDSACKILQYWKSQKPKMTEIERYEVQSRVLDSII